MKKELVWSGKLLSRSRNDVTINSGLTNGSTNYATITFRNDCFKSFDNGHEYFEYSVLGDRMFFRGTDKPTGIRMFKNNEVRDTTRYAKIYGVGSNGFNHWSGDYELQYDAEYELYFIKRKDIQ